MVIGATLPAQTGTAFNYLLHWMGCLPTLECIGSGFILNLQTSLGLILSMDFYFLALHLIKILICNIVLYLKIPVHSLSTTTSPFSITEG